MNTRVAEIIALSTGPDGRVDAARVFAALKLTPDDPVSLIVDGVLAAKQVYQEEREVFQAMAEAHRSELAKVLTQHAAEVTDVAKRVSTEVARLNTLERAYGDGLQQLERNSRLVAEAGASLSTRALIKVFLFGALIGTCSGVVICWFLK